MAASKNNPGDLDLRPFIQQVGVEKVIEAVEMSEIIRAAGSKKVADALGV